MPRRRTGARIAVALGVAIAASLAHAAAPRATLVFCAPGSPGTTDEAQGAMDAFAAAVAERAGLAAGALAATYASTEGAGVARMRQQDAAAALVSLPFLLEHEKALALKAAGLQAAMATSGSAPSAGTERWTLVAARGRVRTPAALAGYTIVSTAGYSPAFVRAMLAGFGELPASVKIAPSAAVLSALRRAAAGEPTAVLLDGAQAAALSGLAFSKDLDVVTRSEPVPVGVVATVDQRMDAATWRRVETALRTLDASAAGKDALAGIRVARFEPLDAAALARARKAFSEAAR